MAEAPADDQAAPPRPGRGETRRSGKRRGAAAKQLAAVLAEALDQKMVVTIDGRRRRITKREAMVAQLVDKSAAADLRAVKLLLDMLKMAEAKAGIAPPAPGWVLDAADEKVIDTLLLRLKLADEAPEPGPADEPDAAGG
jgi:uncharacterized protein DUF5681